MKKLWLYPVPTLSVSKLFRIPLALKCEPCPNSDDCMKFETGRAYADRSGACKKSPTKFTDGSMVQKRGDGTDAPYTPGGQSWTDQFLIFDNSYFTILDDPDADEDLLKLTSDRALFKDDGFRPFAEKFRDSQEEFFKSYAAAHKKLSELGSKFEPAEGITLDAPVAEEAVA